MQDIAKVVAVWRSGGYFNRVMAGGSDLDRVKAFLRICAGERASASADPAQRPDYPCFPGLRHKPWHDARKFEAVGILESCFSAIREEAMHLGDEAEVDYSRATAPWRSWKRPWTLFRSAARPRTWTVYLLHHMGVAIAEAASRCPRTMAAIKLLPRACGDYAWSDCIFSAMAGGAHLRPHCSVDNLRVRIHLGISVPDGCSLRVGSETRAWEEGKCLVFEDSFEHEVWNRSESRRIVLIVDLWHPDLSDVEVRALTAGFRKSDIRRLFMRDRLAMTDAPGKYVNLIDSVLESQDNDQVVREFWPG